MNIQADSLMQGDIIHIFNTHWKVREILPITLNKQPALKIMTVGQTYGEKKSWFLHTSATVELVSHDSSYAGLTESDLIV